MASDWTKGGGFIDFETYNFYIAHGVFVYWGSANALSMFVMSAGLAYIVHEYCTQSHFSSKYLPNPALSFIVQAAQMFSGKLRPCYERPEAHTVVQETYRDFPNGPRFSHQMG